MTGIEFLGKILSCVAQTRVFSFKYLSIFLRELEKLPTASGGFKPERVQKQYAHAPSPGPEICVHFK